MATQLPVQQSFQVPDTLVGKTIREIGPNLGTPERVGELLGYGLDQPFTKGQVFDLYGSPENQQLIGALGLQQFGAAEGPEMRAVRPAINSLEASIPETQQRFATERSRLTGEVDPLKSRYQTLIDDLTRREGVESKRVGTALSNEYGRRGIPLSSGVFEQNLNQNLNDISQFYGIQQRGVVGEREQALKGLQDLIAGLAPQETEAIRMVRNAMAQLQAGAGQSAIENAFKILGINEQQRQFNAQQELTKQQQQLAQRELEQYKIPSLKTTTNDISKNFASLSEGNTLFDLLTGKAVYTAPKTYKPTGVGTGGW